jgi:AcrR family transcriptional regulator
VPPSDRSAAKADELVFRPPQQQRSREAWARILDAGIRIVEDGGYEAFTIAAVCERADVPPRALYERVNTKDGLFLAVYEYKMAQVGQDQDQLFDDAGWDRLAATDVIRHSVAALVELFRKHRAFLRAVILISAVHPEINRRGSIYARALGDRFTAVLVRTRPAMTAGVSDAAVHMCFNVAFSTLVLRTSHGPDYAAPAVDEDALIRDLSALISGYLFSTGPTHGSLDG